MRERSFDEMIAYFNRRVSEMDIAQDYKMELLGMVAALEYKHEKTAQQWIPCSERLPEEDPTFYVAPDERTSRFVIATVIGMTHPHSSPRTLIARYSYTANRWVIRSSNIGNVIAWMPLPQPYKEADNE